MIKIGGQLNIPKTSQHLLRPDLRMDFLRSGSFLAEHSLCGARNVCCQAPKHATDDLKKRVVGDSPSMDVKNQSTPWMSFLKAPKR